MPSRVICALVLMSFSLQGSAQTTLNGAGSTFVYPILAKWAEQYHKEHPQVQITYLPNGSGAGIALTMAGMIDFGGTDAPVSDAELMSRSFWVRMFLHTISPTYRLRFDSQANSSPTFFSERSEIGTIRP